LSERRARGAFAFLRFANDPDAAVAEWDQLRRRRTVGTARSLNDTWGAREYQQMLQDLGFYTGQIHGRHDGPTDEAVKEFQRRNGLEDDGDVGDLTWPVLIRAYLAQDNLSIPDDRLLPNCPGEILRWLGCSELDPVKETEEAWRPNRRTEFLFVTEEILPADVAEPDTFDLPPPDGVGDSWCLNDSGTTTRCCFVVPHLVQQSTEPGVRGKEECDAARVRGPAWRRQLAEPEPSFVVRGSIRFEDGTPLANAEFVLTASDGEYMTGEVPRTTGSVRAGTPQTLQTDADGEFVFDRPATPTRPADAQKTPGVFILEIRADVVARAEGQPLEEAEGPVVCMRLAGPDDSLDVIVVDRAAAGVRPELTAPDVVIVRKPHTNPARRPVQLSVDTAFDGTGTLTVESGETSVRLFDAAAAGNQLAFADGDNVFTSDQLVAGVTLFIEGGPDPSARVDDVELRLLLTVGGQPGFADRERLTAVRLTLDIAEERQTPLADPPVLSEADKINPGRPLQVQNVQNDALRALLLVRRAEPEDFAVDLELTVSNRRVNLFRRNEEEPAPAQIPLVPPETFSNTTVPTTAPALQEAGRRFFVEGARASGAARDTSLQLGLAGIEPDGDRVIVTAIAFEIVGQATAAAAAVD
ncbi:MAG: peptidoglycan-binding protein, partial [bacterium]|nr:peptidoglycan-binding protein [bacterium]